MRICRQYTTRSLLLLLLCAAAGCANTTPYVTTVGVLQPGATLTVRVTRAPVNVYAPKVSQPHDLFTIAATALGKGTPPPAPVMQPVKGRSGRGVIVTAPNPLATLLVRVPDGVNVAVLSENGDVNVTDINGNARVIARRGNVRLMLPGYAQATAGIGNLNVTMGATQWPGTLRFSTQRGDIELWVSAKAVCNVHLHTDDGTLFTDFGLRGTSNGTSETIDGAVNGGSQQRIDVEAGAGSIRLLRLQPQP